MWIMLNKRCMHAKCLTVCEPMDCANVFCIGKFFTTSGIWEQKQMLVSENQLKITANNPEQEEAEEILDVTYSGAEMEIGFNVSYVLDVLNALKCENVRMMLTDSVSSVQIEDAASQSAAYVVMPMRL